MIRGEEGGRRNYGKPSLVSVRFSPQKSSGYSGCHMATVRVVSQRGVTRVREAVIQLGQGYWILYAISGG